MLFFTLAFQYYLVVAFIVFAVFLRIFLKDKSTPKTHIDSWVVIGFSVIFWPIVLPLAHLERQAKKNRKNLYLCWNSNLNQPNPTFRNHNTIPFPYWRLKVDSRNQRCVHLSHTLHEISSHRIQRKIRF